MQKYIYAILILLVFAPASVLAHGLVTSQSQVVGDYKVEFEYNTIGNIISGDFTTFDVHLEDKNGKDAALDKAYVNISTTKGAPILVGTPKQAQDEVGSASLGGIIANAGDYTATVQITKDNKLLPEVKFNFTVDPPAVVPSNSQTKPQSSKTIALEAILVIAGFIVGFFTHKFIKQRSS